MLGTMTDVLMEFSKIVPLGSSGYGAVASLLQNTYRHGVVRKDYEKLGKQVVRLLGIPGASMALRVVDILKRNYGDQDELERKESTTKKRGEAVRRKLDNTQTRAERKRAYNKERRAGRPSYRR